MYKKLNNLSLEHLIKIRSHLGHKNNKLNSKMTSYIYGTRHNINILDVEKLWKPYRYLFYNLVENISKRNSFFIVGINKNLPMEELIHKFMNNISSKKKNQKLFYIKGYIIKKWFGGLFSNWKITLNFLDYIKNSNNVSQKRFRRYEHYLKGINSFKKKPIPDFLLVLNHKNKDDVIKESINLQIPMLGLVDTNMDPDHFLYKFFGNNDSIENVEFLFELLEEAVQEGRLKEQQLFFFYLLIKLKKNINNKKYE